MYYFLCIFGIKEIRLHIILINNIAKKRVRIRIRNRIRNNYNGSGKLKINGSERIRIRNTAKNANINFDSPLFFSAYGYIFTLTLHSH
jgi:hypothetical protein